VVINADGPTAIDRESVVKVKASGAASYVWSPGGQTTAAITVTAAGTYSVVGTDASGCENSASQSVTVNALPTVVINADGPTALWIGSSVILTASGAASYVWSPGGQTTAAITVTAAGTYSGVGTDASGCENSASQSVTVNALPTVVINADGPTAICPGSSVILTASGAASYVWSPGGQTTAAITVTAAGTYSVVGTDASGCENSASQSVTVNALPTVVINADGPTAICPGSSFLLAARPISSYVWSPGGQTTA